jgi:hypothetical protein
MNYTDLSLFLELSDEIPGNELNEHNTKMASKYLSLKVKNRRSGDYQGMSCGTEGGCSLSKAKDQHMIIC